MDLEALSRYPQDNKKNIAMVGLEVLSNASGGQPVSLSQIRSVRNLVHPYQIPLVLDASRIVRNAFLIQEYEDGYADKTVWDIVKQMSEQADHVVMSLTKDFAVPVGGLIATNDNQIAGDIRNAHHKMGYSSTVDFDIIVQSLSEPEVISNLVTRQLAFVKRLQNMLVEASVPILQPAYGHAIVVNVTQLAEGATNGRKKENFLKKLFIETGIRGGLHQVGKQKNTLLDQCIRLALPLGLSEQNENLIFDRLQRFFNKKDSSSATRHHAKTAPKLVAIKQLVSQLTQTQQESLVEKVLRSRSEQQGFGTKIPQQFDIAIIGIGGRYPKASNHYEFWKKIQTGHEFH